MSGERCRFCEAELTQTFVDLRLTPLANQYLTAEELSLAGRFYPLHVYVCSRCLLVQLSQYESPEEIFGEYAYFSSYSQSWLDHCRAYAETIAKRLSLGPQSSIVELASNDGYLLQYFRDMGLPVLGIEPAKNVARIAIEKGIPTETFFFGSETARELLERRGAADLLIGNNVLAHVPQLNDFVEGMRILLADGGVITMEFPHLMRLIERNQFDTIYHEHFSYFSFATAERIFASHRLRLFDVEELPTHGGSIRIYACHDGDARATDARVEQMQALEKSNGLDRIETYMGFGEKVATVKRDLLEFLIGARRRGESVVGYGAPAKGNTLLNYCGIGTDFLEFTVDRNPFKQGRFLPGTHIPVYEPERIGERKPDFVLILPWNLREEIMGQMACVRDWGGRFVTAIPRLEISP